MIPTFLDLRTGKTAKGDDMSVYWWTEGNGACDCNRAIHFEGAYEALDAAVHKAHPELHEGASLCFGCKRFIAIDIEGSIEGAPSKEHVLVCMNSEYLYRLERP